ncbi:MAG: YheU family protein [Proteobacteria bacterium]|nr:YheU family protein [Pseudomonadota bacterium]
MNIPYQSLDPDTLRTLLEEIVTRNGTDYGAREMTLDEKISQALHALETGKARIEFDVNSETCSLVVCE